MSVVEEMRSFWNVLSSESFDHANASKHLVTRTSYHILSINEKTVLDYFLSKRIVNSFLLSRKK